LVSWKRYGAPYGQQGQVRPGQAALAMLQGVLNFNSTGTRSHTAPLLFRHLALAIHFYYLLLSYQMLPRIDGSIPHEILIYSPSMYWIISLLYFYFPPQMITQTRTVSFLAEYYLRHFSYYGYWYGQKN
jgi:hypothetical protein